jgi:hypothetical protein
MKYVLVVLLVACACDVLAIGRRGGDVEMSGTVAYMEGSNRAGNSEADLGEILEPSGEELDDAPSHEDAITRTLVGKARESQRKVEVHMAKLRKKRAGNAEDMVELGDPKSAASKATEAAKKATDTAVATARDTDEGRAARCKQVVPGTKAGLLDCGDDKTFEMDLNYGKHPAVKWNPPVDCPDGKLSPNGFFMSYVVNGQPRAGCYDWLSNGHSIKQHFACTPIGSAGDTLCSKIRAGHPQNTPKNMGFLAAKRVYCSKTQGRCFTYKIGRCFQGLPGVDFAVEGNHPQKYVRADGSQGRCDGGNPRGSCDGCEKYKGNDQSTYCEHYQAKAQAWIKKAVEILRAGTENNYNCTGTRASEVHRYIAMM